MVAPLDVSCKMLCVRPGDIFERIAVGQFFGWLIFLATVLEDLGTTETSIATITTSLGLGFVAGAVAWGLVLVSLIKPIGPGHVGTPRSAIERFLTWCP